MTFAASCHVFPRFELTVNLFYTPVYVRFILKNRGLLLFKHLIYSSEFKGCKTTICLVESSWSIAILFVKICSLLLLFIYYCDNCCCLSDWPPLLFVVELVCLDSALYISEVIDNCYCLSDWPPLLFVVELVCLDSTLYVCEVVDNCFLSVWLTTITVCCWVGMSW